MNTEKKTSVVYINSYFNRIFVRFFDENSELICMESSDSLGLHITSDNIQSVASKVALIAANKAKDMGVTDISGVHVYGPGIGRNNAIQALQDSGFVIPYIKDMNPIPHNGCRPPKRIKKS